MIKFILSPLWAFVTTLLFSWILILNPTILQNIELKIFDQLIVQETILSSDVVLIDISEDTLEKHGQFPLPRDVYGDLVYRLRSSNAGAIVFSLAFSEEDRTGKDKLFMEALTQGVVISHFPSYQTEKRAAYTTGIVEVGSAAKLFVPNYTGIAANLKEYEELVGGVGIANTIPEIDGVVRRVPMVSAVGDMLYPSLTLEVLKMYTGSNTYQIKSNELGVEAVRVKGFPTINTDTKSRVWINPNYSFTRYNLDDEFPDLQGATVFIGVTADGVSNPVPTPTGSKFGHEIAASIFSSVVNKYNISTPASAEVIKVASLIVLGAIIVISSYLRLGWVIALVAIGFASYFPFYSFYNSFELYNTIISGLLALLVFTHVYGVKYGQEYFAKMRIKKQFGTYLSPAMVEKLQNNPELLTLGGETRELSIMFTDVRGFTTISEHYGKDVQGLTSIMNRYMTAMTKRILDNNGTLDKYIGDAQMAFWNAPLDDSNHAVNAVKTALDMLKDLEKFNEEIAKEGIPAFGMGLGINTDTVVVGNMGSEQRFDYTCLGDGVNLASRLEGQSKPYGVKLIIGPITAEKIKFVYPTVELDLIAVKGKIEPVKIYTVLTSGAGTNEFWHYHNTFLKLYKAGDWDAAIYTIEYLTEIAPQDLLKYYEAMLDRISYLKIENPIEWDGVFRATSK